MCLVDSSIIRYYREKQHIETGVHTQIQTHLLSHTQSREVRLNSFKLISHSTLSYLSGFCYHTRSPTSSESEARAPSDSLLEAGPLSRIGGCRGTWQGTKEVTAPTPRSVLFASQLALAPGSHKQEAAQKSVL